VSNCRRYIRLIRSLAYDEALFERCIELMVKIIQSENIDDDSKEERRIFTSLFPIYYSGTRATIDQRLPVIRSLTLSDDTKKRTLGVAGLGAALEAVHFGAGWEFEFGAHSRDYGWWPRTPADVKQWFGQVLNLVEELACSDRPVAPNVRTILAERFRGLWGAVGMYDELERVCHRISEAQFWPEGWIAVRQTIHYDSSAFSPEVTTRLSSLEADLRPKDLLQKVRSIVLSDALIFIGIDSTVDGTTDVQRSMEQVEAVASELGSAVAADQNALAALLPELVAGKNSGQLWSFGHGLAEAAREYRAVWNQLVAQLGRTPRNMQNVQVLRGYLNTLTKSDPDLVSSLLDDSVESEVLGPWYPILQTAVGVDSIGVDRLIRSLEVRKAATHIYRNLEAGGLTHQLSGTDFNRLLKQIATEPEGLDIAIEILGMRISFAAGQSSASELIDIGCELMRRLTFTRRNAVDDYRLGIIAKHCLVGEKGAATVREICRNLKDAVSKSETYAFYHAELLKILLRAQPLAALESLCGGDKSEHELGVRILDQAAQLRGNPFDTIPEADLLTWCDQQPKIRYPAIAAGVTPFQPSGEAGGLHWTQIARKLLDGAPDRVAVLRGFTDKFIPTALRDSRTATIESHARLLDELAMYPDPALVEFITKEKARLADAIKVEQTTEFLIDRDRYGRFE
jgi:hypothetical protein